MKKDTKYKYEKRIKSLQDELSKAHADLHAYKFLCQEIFEAITGFVQRHEQVNQGWLLAKFKRLFR